MRNLPLFIFLALLILPATALAVPVSFTGSVDYGGNIAAGHVISAVSATGTTSKTIYASSFLLNHLGNEGETVAFYFEGMKVGETTQPLPGSVKNMGVLFVPGTVNITSSLPSASIVNMTESEQTEFSVNATDNRNASSFSYLWYRNGILVSNQSRTASHSAYTFIGNNTTKGSNAGNYTITVVASNEAGSRMNASWKLNVERVSDVDGDGIPDGGDSCPYVYNPTNASSACSDDMDGDGVNDTIDSISGNESFITTNIEDIKLKVGSYESVDNKTVNGTNTVKLTVGSYDIVEFEFNFTNSTLDTKNITIKKQENDTKGSIIITGIDLTTQGKTKTVYLDHLNSSSNSVCIKDAEVLSIAEISASCNGANEYLVRCNSTAQYGYTCSAATGSRYMVTGLHHSGLTEGYKAPEPAVSTTSETETTTVTTVGGTPIATKIEITGQDGLSQVADTYVSYSVSVTNKDSKSDTYTMTIDGLPSSWYTIGEPVTIAAKATKAMAYALDLPANATDSSFKVKVTSGSGYEASYDVSLKIVAKANETEQQMGPIASITGQAISALGDTVATPYVQYTAVGIVGILIVILGIRKIANKRKPWNTAQRTGVPMKLKVQVQKAIREDE